MNDIEIIEKIEQYFEGKFQGDQLIEFEKSLQTDSKLAGLSENYKMAIEEIHKKGQLELKEKLNLLNDQYNDNKERNKKYKKQIYLIAAVIAGVAIITAALINLNFSNRKPEKEVLFSEYFSPYINMNSSRGDNSEKTTFLQQTAMYYYSTGQYDKAIINFEELFKNTKSQNIDILFYYGICCLITGQNLKSIEIFSILSKSNKQMFYEQSNWYLALSYLKTNNLKKTKEILRKIIKEKSSYADNALDLLEKISD